MVEVHGDSGAGKTEVLLNAVAHVVAPSEPGTLPRTAVYFDHDGRLDLVRLRTILNHRIRKVLLYNVSYAPTLIFNSSVLLVQACNSSSDGWFGGGRRVRRAEC